MTSIWGPMGWMTLHSISAAYPDSPTDADRDILNQFMDSFANTIACEICRNHFRGLFLTYRQNIPSWSSSKKELFMMVCRLHNNVNKRLDKPVPKTIAECISLLQNATTYTSQSEFRKKYLAYISGEFRGQQGFHASIFIEKMKKINNEYWTSREVAFSDLVFEEDDIVNFRNEPLPQKIFFPRLNMRNVTFPRRP